MVEFRKKYLDQFQKRHNLKLGFMSAFVKASACALVDNPIVNAGKTCSTRKQNQIDRFSLSDRRKRNRLSRLC